MITIRSPRCSRLPLAWGLSALVAAAGCGDDGGTAEAGSEGSESSDDRPGSTDATDATGDDAGSSNGTTGSEGAADESTDGTGTLLERVVEGLGGVAAVEELARFQVISTAERWIADQGYAPGDAPIPGSNNEVTLSVDLTTNAFRVDSSRTYAPFPDQPPAEVAEIVTDAAGYIAGSEGPFSAGPGPMTAARWSSDRRSVDVLNPVLLIREVLAGARLATEIEPMELDGVSYEILELEDPVHPIRLWIDGESGRIERLTTIETSPLHRDVQLEILYEDWRAAGSGLRFPHRVELLYRGDTMMIAEVSEVSTEPRLADDTFELPQEVPIDDPMAVLRGIRNHFFFQMFAYFGTPQDAPQTFIEATELAPGVHFLTGGSHHSMVIEQADGYVVFEPALYPERCEAVANWIDENLADAPITHVVVSHHHLDHSGCVRTMAGLGATVVIHEAGEVFFEDVLRNDSTVEPDALERAPWDGAMLLAEPGSFVELPDPVNPVRVYPLATSHAADMVLPYLPAGNYAFSVDLFSPGLPFQFDPALPAELVDNLVGLGLAEQVEWIVGGHGGVVPASELFEYVGG